MDCKCDELTNMQTKTFILQAAEREGIDLE
jgi:hypothetical protein